MCSGSHDQIELDCLLLILAADTWIVSAYIYMIVGEEILVAHSSFGLVDCCTLLIRGGTEPGGVPKMFSDFGSEGLI